MHETAHAIDEGAVSYIVDKGRSWEYEIKSASGLVQHFHFKQVGDDLEIFYKKLGLDKDIASDADLFTAFLK